MALVSEQSREAAAAGRRPKRCGQGGGERDASNSVLTIDTHPASEPPHAVSVALLSSPLLAMPCTYWGPTHASPPALPPSPLANRHPALACMCEAIRALMVNEGGGGHLGCGGDQTPLGGSGDGLNLVAASGEGGRMRGGGSIRDLAEAARSCLAPLKEVEELQL